MKRSTGLYLILMSFIAILTQMIGPIQLWEFVAILITVKIGCNALIKD